MKRPIQHVVETRSKKAFETLLPDEWVARPLTPDYGIDYMVEIFKDNEATGKVFYVQLKGTERQVADDKTTVRLKTSTLEYYQTLPLPILLVAYSTQPQRFWGLWMNQYLGTASIKRGGRTVQLTLDRPHVIDRGFFRSLEHTFCLEIPGKVNVTHRSDHEMGELYHALLKRSLESLYPNFIVFDDEHFPARLCFNYSYKDKHLMIEADYSVLGSYKLNKIFLDDESILFDYSVFDYARIPSVLSETLFFIATIFAEQNIGVSLSLYRALLNRYSGSFKNAETFFNIGRIAFEKNRVDEFQTLVKKAIGCRNWDDFEMLNLVHFIHQSDRRSPANDYYRENLQEAIPLVDDDPLKGLLSYNLANSYRSTRELAKAVRYYQQARKLEPDYLNRDYWHYELAGVLFLARHYRCAESLYLRAHGLSKTFEPLIFALIGDCKFFQAGFAVAAEWFDKYLEATDSPSSVFCLRRLVTGMLIDRKLERTKRDSRLAVSLANRATRQREENEAIRLFNEAIEADPLCGFAWFNLGVSLHKKQRSRCALDSFLICCLIQDWDSEAWLNALFLSLNLREYSLFGQVSDAAQWIFGNAIFKDVAGFIKKQPHLTNDQKKAVLVELHKILEKLGRLETPDGGFSASGL